MITSWDQICSYKFFNLSFRSMVLRVFVSLPNSDVFEQVKFPYEVGTIIVLVDTCIFLDVVGGRVSDGFASDEVDELVEQK